MTNSMNWKGYIKEQLKNAHLITLGTMSENITWSSPMYFASDKNLTLYVLLDTITQHMKNLIFLPKASVNIDNKDTSYGIQMIGNAEILGKKDIGNIEDIYTHLYQLHTGDLESLKDSKSLDWRLIKITPQKIFLVDKNNPSQREEITTHQRVFN